MTPAKKVCNKCGIEKPISSFEKLPRGIRGVCYRCRDSKAPRFETPRFVRALDSKRYIITAAQNATPVHGAFFETLKIAAKELGAELVVIPLRYKNPTSVFSQAQARDDWWADSTVPFLFNARKKLNPHLVLVGDVKTQPTASSPLTGFEALTGAESCIIGHPKMQFKTVPVTAGGYPKILTTTGICTKANYTDSKAGKIGAFHHYLGALIVEIHGKKFHLRQLNADREDGSFTDLDRKYTLAGSEAAPRALGLVMGDMHARFTCPKVDAATFGPGGIVETLDPETLVFHDVIDGYATNPHHRGNPFVAAAKRLAKFGDVRAEVEHCVEFVRSRAAGRKAVLVSSNHDDFLARWVRDCDWRSDPGNAEFYLETAMAVLKSCRMTDGGADYAEPFGYWVDRLKGDADICPLKLDESFKLGAVECGLHGHHGPNGARGSPKGFARLGTKMIGGHVHAPEIMEGYYQVGTSTPLKLEYTKGPSSWLNTHAVVYASGKRALISIIEGTWRA